LIIEKAKVSEVKIITGDATNMSSIGSDSVDLIITAPPFINRDPSVYGGNPENQINFYSKKMLKLLIKSTKEMERVLKNSGSLWIEISPEDGLMYRYVTEVLNKTGLIHAETVVHKIKNPAGRSKKDEFLYQDWMLWFHFVKDINGYYFNPFKLKNFKDSIWELDLSNADDPVDKEISKSYENIVYYTTPREIPERLIEMYTKVGQTVLDPFGGSGTVAGVAYHLNRNAITMDVSPEQSSIAEKRISLIKENIKNV
jgi:DNA modification methylase